MEQEQKDKALQNIDAMVAADKRYVELLRKEALLHQEKINEFETTSANKRTWQERMDIIQHEKAIYRIKAEIQAKENMIAKFEQHAKR